MSDLRDDLKEQITANTRASRHQQAIFASDLNHIRDNLLEAASRFNDIADFIDEKGAYKDSGFMRASARRWKDAAEGKS